MPNKSLVWITFTIATTPIQNHQTTQHMKQEEG